jgi:threonine/homoserine efflux transporter RhtA
MNKLIKIILTLLFFLSLADMPYGFYQFVRFSGLIGFAILSYQANQQNRQTEMIAYGGLALLFQPFFKITLGREIWNIVDVVVGIGLIISIFWNRKNTTSL